ncbi:6543_t:CDS:1 [Dentiscutata erythropus]|uniref:6543_t:CDS:1 n=1 Tax=Dentiscutata erythropus TaxID=1348616 RepID=A0A9N9GP11_9GLOM|nr:6543_t:CDS:1 [Dentiscutata erythropus]
MHTTFQVLRQDISGLHNEKGIIPSITSLRQKVDIHFKEDSFDNNSKTQIGNYQRNNISKMSNIAGRLNKIRYRNNENSKNSGWMSLNQKHEESIPNTSQPCGGAEKGALRALSNKHIRKSSRNEKLLKWIDSHKNTEVVNKNQDVNRTEVSDTIYKWQSSLRDEKSSDSTNKFTNVIDKIENAISLSVNRICLTMTHNNLSSLHNVLFSLPLYTTPFEHLTHLNFSHNQLSWIPVQIGKLIHLRNLNVSYNQLQEIPCQILKIHGLQQLDIGNNPLIKETEDNSQLIYYYKSAVPKLSELCYRDILNNNKSILFTKYVTKCNYLPKVIRSTLLEPNKRVCAVCDSWHTQSAATLLNFTWVCLVPDVPIRYDFCSVRCAKKLEDQRVKEKIEMKEKKRRRRARFGLGDNGDSTTNSSTNHN